MKKMKVFLVAFACILIAAGGYIMYELKFKSYDVADEKVDRIIDEKFEITLPDGSIVEISKEGEVAVVSTVETSIENSLTNAITSTSNTTTSVGEENANSSNNAVSPSKVTSSENSSSNENNPSNATQKDTLVTIATIKEKYNGTFSLLEEQSRNRINSLIAEAKEEYAVKKNNGEKINYGYFYQKYMGAATSIEQATTSAVSTVTKLVEADLKENGYDPAHAQSFVQQYEKTKESLRNELMKKVLNY